MDLRKSGFLLAKINILFFFLAKGALLVSVCLDGVIRKEAQEYFGIDLMYVGIVGIVFGCALMAKVGEYEKRGGTG